MSGVFRDPPIDDTKAKLSAFEERLEKARRLLNLMRSEDWSAMEDWLAGEIETQRSACMQQGLDHANTERIRGQYWALSRVRILPKTTEKEMLSMVKEVKDLRAMLDRWHTHGRTAAPEAVVAAPNQGASP